MSSLIRVRGGPIVRVFPHNGNRRYAIPIRLPGGAVPPEPPGGSITGTLTVGNRYTDNYGFSIPDAYGATAPTPLVLDGAVQCSFLFCDVSTATVYMRTAGGVPNTALAYFWTIGTQPEERFNWLSTTEWRAVSPAGLVAYLPTQSGLTVPITVRWA